MKTLLLTGFEPFLDFSINPTEEVVNELAGEVINEFQVIGKILPVDFSKSGDQLIDEIQKVNPDAVISLGLAGGRFKITPERIAINCNDGGKDNTGYQPNGEKISESGLDGLFSTLPLNKIVAKLTDLGYPASVSNSAGAYLCNNVMYQSLNYFKQKNLAVPAGFIHIPASHQLGIEQQNIPSWSQRDLEESIRICIHCIDYPTSSG